YNTFFPLLSIYIGCIYCTSYVILLPFNIFLCTSCTLHSLHYLLCLQFTAPVYSHPSLYIFLIFLRPLLCCVVYSILRKYNESHLNRSQIPCLCKLTPGQ